MSGFIEGEVRSQATLFPERIDDYITILCVDDVFVHHFGQASLGELCLNGDYDKVHDQNRRRFESKWNVIWQPHGRRHSPRYVELREEIRGTLVAQLPEGATVAVISKGDVLSSHQVCVWHDDR